MARGKATRLACWVVMLCCAGLPRVRAFLVPSLAGTRTVVTATTTPLRRVTCCSQPAVAEALPVRGRVAQLKKPEMLDGVVVPETMEEALHRFFLGPEPAPRFLCAAMLICSALRFGPKMHMVGWDDCLVVGVVGVFWAFQEWWLHKFLLHAPFKVS